MFELNLYGIEIKGMTQQDLADLLFELNLYGIEIEATGFYSSFGECLN